MIRSIALLTPIYITLVWALVFLIPQKAKNEAKHTLGLFMLLAFFIYISHAIFFSKLYLLYSFFESIYIFALLLLYPVFFEYIQKLANEKQSLKNKFYAYSPAFILGIASLIFTLLMNNEQRILYVEETLVAKNLKELSFSQKGNIKGMLLLCTRLLFIAQIVYYLLNGIKLANKHNRRITNYFSNTEGRRLNWVKDISIVLLIVSAAGIVFSLIGRSYFAKNEMLLLIPSLLFSTIYFEIGFRGNQQVPIVETLNEEDENLETEFEKTENNSLKSQLIQLFEVEKIYKQPDLRITNVSALLDTNRTYISRLINDEFEMNFNEFVNKYRIEETKSLLCNKSHNSYTMEYIAEQAGFGSVASFSRVFKEMLGTTPGKYREDHKS